MFLKNFPTLQKKQKAQRKPNTDRQKSKQKMTLKPNTVNGLQGRADRTPAANSVYVAMAGEVVNQRSVLLSTFVLG